MTALHRIVLLAALVASDLTTILFDHKSKNRRKFLRARNGFNVSCSIHNRKWAGAWFLPRRSSSDAFFSGVSLSGGISGLTGCRFVSGVGGAISGSSLVGWLLIFNRPISRRP
jgi:hypothetical protein